MFEAVSFFVFLLSMVLLITMWQSLLLMAFGWLCACGSGGVLRVEDTYDEPLMHAI